MARESKKGTLKYDKKSECVWNAGIYARLSLEHHNRKDESIDTQIEIAKEYIRKSDNIMLVDCYIEMKIA